MKIKFPIPKENIVNYEKEIKRQLFNSSRLEATLSEIKKNLMRLLDR